MDEAVKGKIDAALQKPTGLTKTKLVGVGTQGQENIEIGDNLTLANGKLSSATAGGGVNGLESDAEGNLTASKNLGVDGKLTLKSLVSASNPDGDITKELGGGGGDEKLYCHCISFKRPSPDKGGCVVLNYFCKKQDKFTYNTFKALFTKDINIACNGNIFDYSNADNRKILNAFYIVLRPRGAHEDLFVVYQDTNRSYEYAPIYTWTFEDFVSEVI